MDKTYGDRYGVLRQVAGSIEEIREHARNAQEQIVPERDIQEKLDQHAGAIGEILSSNQALGQTVLLASGTNMVHLTAHSEQYDTEGNAVALVVTNELTPVDSVGIAEVPVKIRQCIAPVTEVKENGYRIDTKFLLEPEKPQVVTFGADDVLLASIALQRTIIFPAYSSDSLVIPELQSLARREELYVQLTRECPDARWFVRRLKQFERAFDSEDPARFQDIESLDVVHTMANDAADIIKTYPRQRDAVLSLVGEVVGRNRPLIVQAATATTVVEDEHYEILDGFNGRFVDVITVPGGGEKLVAVMETQLNGQKVFVQVPLADTSLFKF